MLPKVLVESLVACGIYFIVLIALQNQLFEIMTCVNNIPEQVVKAPESVQEGAERGITSHEENENDNGAIILR